MGRVSQGRNGIRKVENHCLSITSPLESQDVYNFTVMLFLLILSDSYNTNDLLLHWNEEYCLPGPLQQLLHRTEFKMKNFSRKAAIQLYATGKFLYLE